MFFPNDTTTEIVAHFMGYFDLAVEAARQRQDYTQIRETRLPEPSSPELHPISVDMVQKYAMGAYQPGVSYVPPDWIIRGDAPLGTLPQHLFFPPSIPAPLFADAPLHAMPAGSGRHAVTVAPDPGSVAAVMKQTIVLNDNDLVVLGDFEGPLVFVSGADIGILALHEEAMKVTAPLAGIGPLTGAHDIPLVIEHIVRGISELGEAGGSERMSVTPTALEGVYLNGAATETASKLVDVLPERWHKTLGLESAEEADEESEAGQGVSLLGDEVDGALVLQAGGNLLVNDANIFEAGLTSAVFAVRGDVHQLDVIIQTNAYYDIDSFADGFLGETVLGQTSTYNIASFIAETRDLGGQAAAANPGLMPFGWNVSVVNGDLVFVEWLKQFTFSSDQDMAVLSATGATTFITTGENAAVNSLSFANLGFYYDLVIVGGRLYDANIISQTNILYDNDVIEMLGGSMLGKGNASGNLLWNEASIHNVGPTEFTRGLPDHYLEAMNNLAEGNSQMPAGFMSGKEFEGFGALKVLYISGNLYDLRYVEQSNVLGDADFVAVQKAKALSGVFGKNWEVDTGSNSLVNMAKIKDFDSLGNKAFAGANVYSDAVLIQADIIGRGNPGHNGALVSEVVAFLDLDKGFDAWSHDGFFGPALPSADGPAVDILQSMLA